MFLVKYKILLYAFFLVIFTYAVLDAQNLKDVRDVWHHWDRGMEHINGGKESLLNGDSKKASDHFQYAESEFNYFLDHKLSRMYGVAYFGRAQLSEARGNYEQAIEEYKRALKNDLHPSVKVSSKAYMNMGTIYVRNKNYEEAIKVYLKAIEIKPENGLAHYFLGLTYFESGDYENAEKQAIEAKELGVKYSALSDKLKKLKSSSSKKMKKK